MKKYLLPLILILLLSITVTGYCVTELDYMEYANDSAAQGAYVTSNTEAIQKENSNENGLLSIGDSNNTEYRYAQTFTISKAIIVTQVKFTFAAGVGSPSGDVTVTIETDSGSLPSGTLVDGNATKAITVTPSTENTWDFTDFLLEAGTYWIVLNCDNQATNNRWWIQRQTPAEVVGGMAESTDGGSSWSPYDNYTAVFKLYGIPVDLQCYSESSIKEQGDYSLKGFAIITDSLNDTLTRTVNPTIDLTDQTQIKYDIRGSRTGSQIKIGIHDSGGTTSEHTANIASANTWQTETWDISEVSNANKDVIDSIIVTIVNADADNAFYIDNMYAEEIAVGITWNGITISKWNGVTITIPINTQ